MADLNNYGLSLHIQFQKPEPVIPSVAITSAIADNSEEAVTPGEPLPSSSAFADVQHLPEGMFNLAPGYLS